jgi:hypothetical protein
MSFNIDSVAKGLEYGIKGEGVKMDVIDVVLDHKDRESISSSKKKENYCRYMLLNAGVGFVANVNRSA